MTDASESIDLDEHERMNYWWRRAKEAEERAVMLRESLDFFEAEAKEQKARAESAERRIEKAEDFVTRHYLDTNMGEKVLAALNEGDKQ